MAETSETPGAPATKRTPKDKDAKGVMLTSAVVAGHAFKHVYIAGFQNIIFPEMKIGLGLSNTMLGALSTARQATSGVTTLGAGYLGDRFSRHAGLLLAISLGLMGVSHFLVGSASNLGLIFAAMLLVGLGPSLYHPPALGALTRRFPQRRGFMISLHGTGGSIGEALGPLAAAAAVAALAWQGTLQWSLLPALAAAVLVWLMMRAVPSGAQGTASLGSYFGALGKLFSNRSLMALLAVSGVRSLGQSAVALFLPVYLRQDLGYSAARVAVYLSLAQVAGIAVQPVMGALSDRFGRKAVLVPSLMAFGALLVGLWFVEPGFWLVAVVLGMGMFLYSLQALFLAAASDLGGGEVQATIASMTYGVTFVAATISPLVAGAIADTYDVPSTFLYGAALIIVSGVLVSRLRLARAPRGAESRI